ncbi:MAG TPA: EpsI family protein [Sphingomonadaceae bacterium]|nr:EpsI family protein [Sphingomonadaceae bacterium]
MSDRKTFLPSRRDIMFGGSLAAASAIAYARTPRVAEMAIHDDELEKIIPYKIGKWTFQTASGLVLPPPDQLAEQLYSQQLTRVYATSNMPAVMLLIAYGNSQNGMLQLHRPEVCYPAGGYTLSDSEVLDVPLHQGGAIPTRRFTAVSATRVEQLLYWTRIGDMLPISWTAQRWAVVENNLAGVIPDGVLVRLSTISMAPEDSNRVLSQFAATMIDSVGPRGRRLLIGRDYGRR